MKRILLLIVLSMPALWTTSGQEYELNLFRNVCSSSGGNNNVVISPFSARMALAMTSAGAGGATCRQMLDALGFGTLDQEEVNILNRTILNRYCRTEEDVTFEMANGLWTPKQVKLNGKFKKKVIKFYDAGIGPLNLDAINAWCDQTTHHFIPKLMEELPANTLLALTNALYMKATWSTPFANEATKKASFTDSSGKIQNVDMMQRQGEMKYCSNDEFEMVELPYGKGTFVMDILLPKNGLDQCIASLNDESWAKAVDALSMHTVNLQIPKFDTECAMDLSSVLENMGMVDAFTSAADFSKMTKMRLFISMVFQKVRVKVNEQGTEAAAVTAVMMTKMSRPQFVLVVPFTVNRPFVFVIRETASGTICFTGRMNTVI